MVVGLGGNLHFRGRVRLASIWCAVACQALPGYGGLHGRGGPGWVGYGGDLEGVGENLRTIELRQLPGDATSLVFGDWLAMLEPVVAELMTLKSFNG